MKIIGDIEVLFLACWPIIWINNLRPFRAAVVKLCSHRWYDSFEVLAIYAAFRIGLNSTYQKFNLAAD